jgi:hypothetical protein
VPGGLLGERGRRSSRWRIEATLRCPAETQARPSGCVAPMSQLTRCHNVAPPPCPSTKSQQAAECLPTQGLTRIRRTRWHPASNLNHAGDSSVVAKILDGRAASYCGLEGLYSMDSGSRFYCPRCRQRLAQADSRGSPAGRDKTERSVCAGCGAELTAEESTGSVSRKLAELKKFGLLTGEDPLLEPRARRRWLEILHADARTGDPRSR